MPQWGGDANADSELILATLKEEIGKTVLHEVGHFFGLNEEDMVRLDIH